MSHYKSTSKTVKLTSLGLAFAAALVPASCLSSLADEPKSATTPAKAESSTTVTFEDDAVGKDPKDFATMIGDWYVTDDKGNKVFCVDGRKWAKGKVAPGVAEKARALYGDRYAEFLDRVQTFAYFPLAVFKPIENFKNGDISMRFKGVGGKIDQCAGIVFNMKSNGDYLIFRGNSAENNVVLWKYEKGKRKALKWIRKVQVPSGKWHDISVSIKGPQISGFYNGSKVLDYTFTEPIDGKVGLWSKADSLMYFDDYTVTKE